MRRSIIHFCLLCVAVVGCAEKEKKKVDESSNETAALKARLDALESTAAKQGSRIMRVETLVEAHSEVGHEEEPVGPPKKLEAREIHVVDADGISVIVLREDRGEPEIFIRDEHGDERHLDLPGPAPLRPRGSKPGPIPAREKAVAILGEDHRAILRGCVDEQLQDLGALGRQARVIPNYDRESGSYKGFKLIGVRPNSLYRNIGIRSGDVILQVNGEEMNSPSKVLELFNRLQSESRIVLSITRRGAPYSLSIDIVDKLPEEIPAALDSNE